MVVKNIAKKLKGKNKDDKDLNEVLHLWHVSERSTQTRKDDWHRWYKLYRSFIDEPSFPWQSFLSIACTCPRCWPA